jgi:UDP-N-acetyl-D-glucosamine dehydrogenase
MKYFKKHFKIAIIGLGYVGLPLYLLCKKRNFDIFGFDLNKKKIKDLNNNISNNTDIKNSILQKIRVKNIFNMDQVEKINDRNIIIFCLPTPVKNKNIPDMSYIKNALKLIKDYLKEDILLILESTVYPGATREIFENFISKNALNKIDISYGFSSERISPGQTNKKKYKINYQSIPKVISANNKKALKKMNNFYKSIFKRTYITSSLEVAEMSKLLENTYRAVNIGLVNEFKILCYSTNINVHEVIDAAATKPFGFVPFRPGPGVGGHCIPIDPLFLSWHAKKYKVSTDFIELARKKNLNITNWISKNIFKLINLKKNINKILIIGMAYKEDINDSRESPSIKFFENILRKKIKVDYYDPFIPEVKIGKKSFLSIKSLKNISKYNICILATSHSNLPYKKILKESRILVDTRGKYKNEKNKKLYFF